MRGTLVEMVDIRFVSDIGKLRVTTYRLSEKSTQDGECVVVTK